MLDNFTIKLEGKHFSNSYLVYILRLGINGIDYHYIGQTGDNNHITARPAFRRLAGHFEDSNTSTQNKIYRFMAREFIEPVGENKVITREVRSEIEKLLMTTEVEIFVYPLMEFDYRLVVPQIHKEKVKRVKEFEKHVIHWFDQNDYRLINSLRAALVIPMNDLFPEKMEAIKQDFPVQIPHT